LAEESLSVRFSRVSGTVVVSLGGVLDDSAAGRLRHLLLDVIEGQGNLSVVFDVGGLRMIGAHGEAVLGEAQARVQRRRAAMPPVEAPDAEVAVSA